MKCVKCDLPATYNRPDNLCEDHWIDWWQNGAEEYMTTEELAEERGLIKREGMKQLTPEDINNLRELVKDVEVNLDEEL